VLFRSTARFLPLPLPTLLDVHAVALFLPSVDRPFSAAAAAAAAVDSAGRTRGATFSSEH
jgi:hypothetical protein